MARSAITDISTDLIDDSGSVLWSIVRGEQLEYPVELKFIETANAGYIYEAVVVEALNLGDGEKPTTIRPSGAQSRLNVRTLVYRGLWEPAQAYNREEYVKYSNGKYYKLLGGVARTSSTTPDLDPLWEEYTPNTVYVQFPKTLSVSPSWTVGPDAETAVYGFFELRVTEPTDAIFTRTWKPVRGLVEVLFSPTDIVPDL